MLLILVVVSVLVVFFYHYGVKPLKYWKERGVKEGNPVWFFGDYLGMMLKQENFADMVIRCYKQHPTARYLGMYQFSLPTLLVKDPQLLKQMFVKDFDHFTDHRSFIPDDADPLWSRNIFALKGQKWRNMRSVLSPSYTSSKLRGMFELISECSENVIAYFMRKNEDFLEVEMKDLLTRFTNDIIATAAFGVKVDSLDEPNNEFYLMAKEAKILGGFWKMLRFFGYLIIPRVYTLLKIPLLPNNVGAFFRRLIHDTIKTREENHIIRPDMIHLLMEARKGIRHKDDENEEIETGFATIKEAQIGKGPAKAEITELDIVANALIFFFAGFETVSSIMCFLSYELAVNPDVQTKLRREIEATLVECNGNLTYDALMRMKYMDMVVSELLRKWPNAGATDRVCTKPYTIEPMYPDEQPVQIKENDVVFIPIMAVHYDPQYYPEPERFDPERFSDENKERINPYTYMPFGLGPRGCIGSRFALLEIKIVFFRLLSHFEIVPTEKTVIPLKLSKSALSVSSEGDMWLGFKRLEN